MISAWTDCQFTAFWPGVRGPGVMGHWSFGVVGRKRREQEQEKEKEKGLWGAGGDQGSRHQRAELATLEHDAICKQRSVDPSNCDTL